MGTCQICVPPNSHWTSCFSSLPIKHFLVPSFQVYITNKKQVKPLETKDITTQNNQKLHQYHILAAGNEDNAWPLLFHSSKDGFGHIFSLRLTEAWITVGVIKINPGSLRPSTATNGGFFSTKWEVVFKLSHVVWSCIFFAHSSYIMKAFKSTFCCSCSAKLLSLRSMVRCLDDILHHSIYEFC